MFLGSNRVAHRLRQFTLPAKSNSYNLRSFKKIGIDSDLAQLVIKPNRFTRQRLGHTRPHFSEDFQSIDSPPTQRHSDTYFYPYPYPYPYPWENSLDIYYYHLMSTQTEAPATADVPAPSGKLIKADSIAAKFRSDIEQTIRERTASSGGRKPKLVGILATDSKPSESYAEFTQRTCDSIGVEFVLKRVGGAILTKEGEEDVRGVNGEGVEEAIIEANEDSNVDGIMVYYPIFGGLQDHYLQQVVSPFKDVEGLHSKFHFHLYHNVRFIRPQSLASSSPFAPMSSPVAAAANTKPASQQDDTPPPGTVKSIIPCTPLAIVKCLEYLGVYNTILSYGDRAYGKTITIINRSEVVGRPLAALLANDGARVFSVDIDSIQEYTKRPTSNTNTGPRRLFHPRHVVHPSSNTLEECLALSDVVISAVPSANYKVKTAGLKDGCVCVNISSEKNFDKDVREKASLYLPSIGKVTIMMLLRNLMRLCHYQDILREEGEQAVASSV